MRFDDSKIIRLERRQLGEFTLVIRCNKGFKVRFRLALWLMRIAGRIGGFKSVKLVREH